MECDLIITGGTVITMVPGSEPIEDGAVAVKGDEIIAVDRAAALVESAPTTTVLDARGGIIMPGFVNTHTHLAMTLLRGFADDLPLKTWLEEHIWPAERALMNAENVALGSRLAIAESLLAGVTTVCDMYFHAETIIGEVERLGIRAVVPESLIDFPTPACPTPEHALARQRELLEKYAGHGTVVPAVAAHAPYSVSAANLAKEAELADEFGAPLIIHVAETRWEVESLGEEKGTTPVAYLADLGILSERTVAAHCVHVSEADLEIMAEFDIGVATNPVANLKLASGVAPVPQMLARGLKVGFGTDGAASNNTLDLLRDAQLAALLYKGVTGDASVMPARTLLEMLTLGGARVLGLDDRVGSLEPGKQADVICLSTEAPHAFPAYEPLAHVAYAARSADVLHVTVAGRPVVQDGQLTSLDPGELRSAVEHAKTMAESARG